MESFHPPNVWKHMAIPLKGLQLPASVFFARRNPTAIPTWKAPLASYFRLR